MLKVEPIQTKLYRLGDDFNLFLKDHLKNQSLEGKVIAITTKIVSLAENAVLPTEQIDKLSLVKKESDYYLGEIAHSCHLTIKNNLMLPSAGIDESNCEEEFYILYPKDPYTSAKKIYDFLKEEFSLKKFGVLLTDSHTMPLRKGVVGAAVAYHGFEGVDDKRGEKDLFGRELKMTRINIADALAIAATYTMGEGNESRPLALIEAPLNFDDSCRKGELGIPLEEDLYEPIIRPLV